MPLIARSCREVATPDLSELRAKAVYEGCHPRPHEQQDSCYDKPGHNPENNSNGCMTGQARADEPPCDSQRVHEEAAPHNAALLRRCGLRSYPFVTGQPPEAASTEERKPCRERCSRTQLAWLRTRRGV